MHPSGPKRYLSGIQPTGRLHLGNYFGAIRQHLALQQEGSAFYFLANYHALTTIQDAETLRRNTREAAVTYLALGLDPAKAVLFRQSDVPEVTELTWLLLTVTGMGLLERAVSYKDKLARGLQASAGLFAYPVLMAADILAYDSHVVPVGADQVQHVEMARDMAQAFNHVYGEVFVLPEYRMDRQEARKVPGLDGAKMSKSYDNTIPIFAEGRELKRLVMSIKTDSTPVEEPKDPERCTVFTLYSLFADPQRAEDMRRRYLEGGYGYGEAKKELLARIQEHFVPAFERRRALEEDPSTVEDVLREGGRKAREVARSVTDRARSACGLV